MNNRRDEIIDAIGKVKAIPVWAAKAVSLLQNSNKGLNEVIKIIEYDPAITVNLLKLANSSAFSSGREIASLQDAAVRLGANNILQMLISSAMSEFMNKPVKGYDLPPGELWKSSVMTALCTDIIREVLNINLPSHTFTAGLLRDIGKIVLGSFIGIDAGEILKHADSRGISFVEAENEILGIDHSETGAILLRKWNLPEELETPVRWHHDPDKSPEYGLVTDVVHLADSITILGGVGTGMEGLQYRICGGVVERLGLDISKIETIVCKTQFKYDELKDIFPQ